MTKKISITISDWVYNEIIGDAPNKSEKIEELVVKSYMDSRLKHKHQSGENNNSGEKIWTSDQNLNNNNFAEV